LDGQYNIRKWLKIKVRHNNINSIGKVVLKYLGKDLDHFFTPDTIISFNKNYNSLFSNSIENFSKINNDFFSEAKNIVQLIVNVAEKEIKGSRFLDLLIVLSRTLINLGNYSLPEELLKRVIKVSFELGNLDFAANAYLNLGVLFYRQAYWEKSLKYLTEAKKLFEKERFEEGIIKSLNTMGALAGEKGEFTKAELYFTECLNMLDNNLQNNLLANVVDNNGIVHLAKSNYDVALSEFNRAKAIFILLHNKVNLAYVLYNIGLTFLLKDDFNSAIKEFDNSSSVSFEAENVRILNLNLSAKATVFATINDYDQSFAYLNKSMELSTTLNDRLTIADLYKVKGILNRKLKKKKKAEKYFLTSLKLNEELENKFNYFETMLELGLLYKEWKKNDLAKENLTKAFNYKLKIGAENASKEIEHELKRL